MGTSLFFSLQPLPESVQLYDAVMLYAYGLNKTLSKGYSVTNGSDIIQNILNTRHESKTKTSLALSFMRLAHNYLKERTGFSG